MARSILFKISLILLFNYSYAAQKPEQVLLVSIDGLRPEFYLSDDYDAPTLKSLVKSGAHAKYAETIYPSVTYPNHTTIVTGVSSAKHGILTNTVFDSEKGLTGLWYWEEKYVKVPTLWQKAKAAGKTVAILRWPASVGAKVDWIIPEIFSAVGIHHETDWERIVKHFDKKLLDEILSDAKQKNINGIEQVDPWTTYAAGFILEKYHPQLALLHLINVDFVQHQTGRNSSETKKALKALDSQLGSILSKVDMTKTAVVVVGDHGFIDYNKIMHLNALFTEQGWIQEKSWKVLSHSDGGQTAIYVKNRSMEKEVKALLEKHAPGKFKIFDRNEIQKLKAYPNASFSLVAEDGYVFGAGTKAPWLVELNQTRGHHGQLPSHPQMRTGFIAAGAGIKPGVVLEKISLLDVAPTVASLLKIKMPSHVEGKVIPISQE